MCFSGLVSRVYQNFELLLEQLKKYQTKSNFYDIRPWPYEFEYDFFFSHSNDAGIDESVFYSHIVELLERADLKNCLPTIEFTSSSQIITKYQNNYCWSNGNSITGIWNQFESIKNSDSLRRQREQSENFRYDIVIRTRPDIEFTKPIDLRRAYHLSQQPNVVLFPGNWNFHGYWYDHTYLDRQPGPGNRPEMIGQGMLCDQWFAASSNVMTLTSQVYDNIEKYVDSGCRLHPETLLWWHVTKTMKATFIWLDFKNKIRGVTHD